MVVLVWLVAARVRLSAAPGTLIGVLVALILAPALPGMLLAGRLRPSARISVVLNVPMTDFAIASGIAAAASGPRLRHPWATVASSWPVALWPRARLVARVRAGRHRITSRHHLSADCLVRRELTIVTGRSARVIGTMQRRLPPWPGVSVRR